MRIYHNQLTATLGKPPLPVWLIFGDEPWQKTNSIFTIKQHFQQQGFEEIIQFSVDDKFDWTQLVQEYQAMSLFSSLRIIELELLTTKIGDTGSKILTELAQQLVPDVLLLIHGNKLDGATQKRKWFKALESNGAYLPLYDIEGKHLQQWIQKQSRAYQLNMLPDVVFMLAELFEGNLNALDQELQKLSILFGQQLITTEQAQQLMIKQAKFNPFQLIDAMLQGDMAKCISMLDQLQHDGTAAGQLLWFIHKEIKQLNQMQEQLSSGQDIAAVFKEFRIWEKRKPLYQKALNTVSSKHMALALSRIADVDLTMKTSSDFNPFVLITDVITTLYHGEVTTELSLNYEYLHA
ncbi:DNA polymerase III subunit delta [Thalassotalea sediminis]|uniref:DNA polymerase III subunit delta n=1 Tax=Thalassotalea sediminis TaxID=1759089 RepID=UPI0025729022|nr:DNA polymerase III subunit delta [Thalassotalea sediminis]